MKLSHPRFFAIVMMICSHHLEVFPQDETTHQFTTQVTPMTPNASALAKYVDVPVSYYTGTPQISVPLYEIKSGVLSVPVALSYHASGNRVNDVSSVVGLGWTLMAGGSISRSVRGLPDESVHGYLNEGYKLENPTGDCQNGRTDFCEYLQNISIRNLIDSEPDIFFLNLPGGGGVKFAFDYNGKIVMQNYQQIQITKDASMSTWTVLDEHGTRYKFGRNGRYGGRDTTRIQLEGAATQLSTTSWHLSQIISPDRQDTISFEYRLASDFEFDDPTQEVYYQRDTHTLWSLAHEDVKVLNCGEKAPVSRSPGLTSMFQRTLSKISSRLVSLEFIPSIRGRHDLSDTFSIDSILIRRSDGVPVKSFGLKHGYFGTAKENNQRLKLNKLTEYSATGQPLPPYEFFYDERYSLPQRNSFKQDHWGYYNNNPVKSFIPNKIYRPDGTFMTYINGGRRDTDSARVKAGMLSKIVYPTGGYDVFEFEAHDICRIAGKIASEYYDEVHSFRVSTYHLRESQVIDTILNITETTQASITAGGSCHGVCGWKGSCEKAGASALFHGIGAVQDYTNVGWSCPVTPHVTESRLLPGQYAIKVAANWEADEIYSNAYVEVVLHKQRNANSLTYLPVGGVRIKRIKRFSSPDAKPVVRRFIYKTKGAGSDVSSGVLVQNPMYYGTVIGSGSVNPNFQLLCYYEAGYSDSRISLGEGTHIGYSEVRVLQGERGENGYEVFKYTTASDWPDFGPRGFPNAPRNSRDNRRGLLTEHSVYDRINNPVSKTFYSHRFSGAFPAYARGLKAGMMIPQQFDHNPSHYSIADYNFFQEWHYPDTVRERLYSFANDGSFTETITVNFYERTANHAQLTRQERSQTDGSWMRTRFKYPQDYSASTELANINQLVTRHIYSPPIEIQTWKITDDLPVWLSGRIADYDSVAYQPSRVYAFNATGSTGAPANETSVNDRFVSLLSDNSKYELRAQSSYMAGKLISQFKDNDLRMAYVWGYSTTQPIAEVKNAEPPDVAFTSFEDRSDGTWTITSVLRNGSSFTGLKGYSLADGSVSKTGLNPGKTYLVSFWARSGNVTINGVAPVTTVSVNGWSLNVVNVAASSITISGNALIDELRLHPVDAQMVSYTFDPLVGITSLNDANNKVTYYEYDSFQRLGVIKDFTGNVLKRYTYNYATR